MFGTWGPQDLTELQRNMRFFGMEPLGTSPVRFYDIQKLFSIAYEDQKSRRSLEYAVDFLKIEKTGRSTGRSATRGIRRGFCS